jgi:beta-lactamase regulating signal transducer with metallopeptidase domain
MQQLVFLGNAYFLQSLGWALANSFWQATLLWALYKVIISANKKSSSSFRYNLSLVFLFNSFIWFLFTLVHEYLSLKNTSFFSGITNSSGLIIKTEQLSGLLPFLSAIYIIALFFYSVRFTTSYRKAGFIQKSGLIKAPVNFRIFINNTALHLGIKNKVEVWLSEYVDVPSVIGFVKPMILLPVSICTHLTTEQTEAILLHELVHIKRNDYFINFLQSVIELIFFFNPFVLLLADCAKKERENCCDDWVLNYQYNKYQYANALLILEEQRHQQLIAAMTSSNDKKNLLHRIKRFHAADQEIIIKRSQKLSLAVLCLLIVPVIFFLLPSMNKMTQVKTITAFNKMYSLPLQQKVNEYPFAKEEANTTQSINIKPSLILPEAAIEVKKRNIKKVIENDNTNDNYTIALINKDLLHKKNIATAISAADMAEDSIGEYFVKIEEQQSGKKRENVYYFELNKNDGEPTVKPLIFLQKPVYKTFHAKKKIHRKIIIS